MEFSGLIAADLAEVRALNVAFLEYLGGSSGEHLRHEMPVSMQRAVASLSDRHIQRLSTVPFLLLSCRETDEHYWESTSHNQPVRDLFTPIQTDADPVQQIGCATLGFLWHLARRNSYATRLVCGASLDWCEQLAACSLLQVLQQVADDLQVLAPRLADDKIFWHRLLGAGLNSNAEIRRAAHLSALQSVLSSVEAGRVRSFRTAACYSSVPAVQVQKRCDK